MVFRGPPENIAHHQTRQPPTNIGIQEPTARVLIEHDFGWELSSDFCCGMPSRCRHQTISQPSKSTSAVAKPPAPTPFAATAAKAASASACNSSSCLASESSASRTARSARRRSAKASASARAVANSAACASSSALARLASATFDCCSSCLRADFDLVRAAAPPEVERDRPSSSSSCASASSEGFPPLPLAFFLHGCSAPCFLPRLKQRRAELEPEPASCSPSESTRWLALTMAAVREKTVCTKTAGGPGRTKL
mmetsp:Transcript_4506/g.17105  ORF Transcript_4506/g.17105 Transcript_4506/m.17105 type:complete len:254 (-) Transcript_4506:11-772(-)